MKTAISFFVFLALLPLLCERNSLLGIRIYYNSSKGFSHLNGDVQTFHITAILVCVTLYLSYTIIAFLNWTRKLIYLSSGRYGGLTYTGKNIRELQLRLGEYLTPPNEAEGTLIRLNGGMLEMLIWFILHDQLRVDLRVLRLFPINRRATVYTVEQILEGQTEELRALQQFIFKSCGAVYPENHLRIAEQETKKRCEEGAPEPCIAIEEQQGGVDCRETQSCTNDDDSDSHYEPANVIRRALTVIFSRVNKGDDETSSVQNVQHLDKVGGKMDGSESPEYSGNDKDEETWVARDCLLEKRRKGGKSPVVNVSESKECVEDMKGVVRLMSAESCVVKEEFIGSEGLPVEKMKTAEKRSRSLIFQEDSMEKEFKEERFLYSSDVDDELKKTIKAYYGMAGGFTNEASVSSTQVQEIEKEVCDISEEEWKTLDRIYKGRRYVQKFPIPRCVLGQLQAETMPVDMERKANSRLALDYSKIAIGCGVAAFTLFAVYKCFRR